MGAGSSMEEGREYFWQTFFWLECGKTGIGIAKLRVFDDEMVTDSTQSTVPLSELRKKELFDDSDGVMKYGNDTDIEKGENAPLAALLPEPKKELLPPLEQSPSQLEISGDDVGRQVPGEKKPLPSPAPIQKSKSTKKAEEEKKRKEEEDKLKVEEEKKRQEEENEKLTAERLKKLEEDEAIVENLRKELQEELVRRIQNDRKRKEGAIVEEEEEYEEVEEEDDLDGDEIKLVKKMTGEIKLKKKRIRKKSVHSSMATGTDGTNSTETGTDGLGPLSESSGVDSGPLGSDEEIGLYRPSAKLFPLLVVRKMKAAAGIGGVHDGSRPLLAELRALNKPGPDEDDGVTSLATGHDEYDPSDPKRLLRSEKSLARTLEMRSVLVAVRMRPFNKRERGLKDTCCIEIPTSTKMIVKGASDKGADRDFNFDCAFGWDATQVQVYKRTGRPLLIKALNGYNACLFAYGQTGSGKTYTMLGEAEDRGVIPLMLDELFENCKAQREHGRIITVTMSMLEIYNEHLHDLLVRTGTGTDKDLAVREDKIGGRGIFVDGLTEFQVDSAQHALKLLNDAQGRRAVGRTNMNEHSSRSHAVITLHINVVGAPGSQGVIATNSKLHLIDLAGSERQSKTGASGDQLKEGAAINLSLTALGNVINALTEATKGNELPSRKAEKGKKDGQKEKKATHIPYRDSKLTRILQDSLGGNSVTCMLTAMSPAESNKEETVSALRFAERAKRIENKVKKNVNAKELALANSQKLSKALQAKIDRLMRHIERLERYY